MNFRPLILASLSTASLLVSCDQAAHDVDNYRNGVPRTETVEMKVPASATGQALSTEQKSQALRGDISDFYKLTRTVSGVVNGSGAVVLGLVKAVISYPPTQITANSAVWGPWKGPLDPIAWRVTVTRTAENQYSYLFEGRDKQNDEAPFVTVLSGTHSPTVDAAGHALEGFGSGTFTLDWDARNTLPVPENNVGKATYVYARASLAATVTVDAQFRKVKDDERPGQLVDVDYGYRSTPGTGGSMQFVHTVPAVLAKEGARWAVKSRWAETGAGRSDVRAIGGDVPAGTTATASECWNTHFTSQFIVASWLPNLGYGTEATDCLFTPAEYSDL